MARGLTLKSYLRIHAHIKRSISKHTETSLGIVDLRKSRKGRRWRIMTEEGGGKREGKKTCMDDIPKSIKMPSTPEEKMSGWTTCLRRDLMCLKLSRNVKAWKWGWGWEWERERMREQAIWSARGSTSIPMKSLSSGWAWIIWHYMVKMKHQFVS